VNGAKPLEAERKKLLEAALDEFCEKGVGRARLEAIAERAGTSLAVTRALFVDKENLFKTALREWTDPFVSTMGLAVKADDPREMLRHTLRLMDRWLVENPRYVRLVQWAALEEDKALANIYDHSLYPSEFYEKLETLVDEGHFRPADAFTVLMLLDSLIFFAHMVRPSFERMVPGKPPEELFEARLEAILDLLEHGLHR
jgi:AcrR family transcriptional regulator